jgi:methanogenic corrinoid protein MtbC1
MVMHQGHAMKVAVNRTGLSPHVIRMWEKRYAAVTPERTPTNRRLYSDADMQRLSLLRQATLCGHSIGNIANLPTDRLLELVAEDSALAPPLSPVSRAHVESSRVDSHVEACIAAVERLDPVDLEATLMRARMALSQPAFIDHVITPLMVTIGDCWRDGSLRVMHEHLATAVVRTILGSFQEATLDTATSAPAIVVTTPAGQLHEIGALMAASTAASEGWAVTYLGANLPSEDIAAAAQDTHARAVALSLVYPADDPHTEHELAKLRRCLAPDLSLMVGGHAAAGYGEALTAIGAVHVPDMPDLRVRLETLRRR